MPGKQKMYSITRENSEYGTCKLSRYVKIFTQCFSDGTLFFVHSLVFSILTYTSVIYVIWNLTILLKNVRVGNLSINFRLSSVEPMLFADFLNKSLYRFRQPKISTKFQGKFLLNKKSVQLVTLPLSNQENMCIT